MSEPMTEADFDPYDIALTRCCIDTCDRLAHSVIESYPDDIGLCREHRPLHGELLPWEDEYVIGEPDEH